MNRSKEKNMDIKPDFERRFKRVVNHQEADREELIHGPYEEEDFFFIQPDQKIAQEIFFAQWVIDLSNLWEPTNYLVPVILSYRASRSKKTIRDG